MRGETHVSVALYLAVCVGYRYECQIVSVSKVVMVFESSQAYVIGLWFEFTH